MGGLFSEDWRRAKKLKTSHFGMRNQNIGREKISVNGERGAYECKMYATLYFVLDLCNMYITLHVPCILYKLHIV